MVTQTEAQKAFGDIRESMAFLLGGCLGACIHTTVESVPESFARVSIVAEEKLDELEKAFDERCQ